MNFLRDKFISKSLIEEGKRRSKKRNIIKQYSSYFRNNDTFIKVSIKDFKNDSSVGIQ